jgi:hypothetical protein
VSEVPLRELAQVIRSKNAGPFELTFDIIFNRKAAYEEVKASGALTAEKLAGLYNIPPEDILVAMFFDPAMAFKMTVKRRWQQGSSGERDTFGAAQHAPLMDIMIPSRSNLRTSDPAP